MFEEVVRLSKEKHLIIKTMESCTGGAVASAITDVEGASYVLKESYITYCNESKIAHGVDADIIKAYSVYSDETAIDMAKACLRQGLSADIGIGITGNFGNIDPYNVRASTPGIVYIAIVFKEQCLTTRLTLDLKHNRKELKIMICKVIAQHLEKLLHSI